MRAALRRRAPLAAQDGSLLVEVMVGSIVLAITTLAVLDGLDGAQETGVKNKARTEYANLAQQDIERLRSQPITAIANLDQTRTVRVGSVDYSVRSKTEWTLDDPATAVSCTDYNPLAEYLKVTSTVTSPASINNPVTETTLLTPAPGAFGDTGTATVHVTDRDGGNQAGVSVALTGPGTYSAVTNALGCAVFRYIPGGSYTAQVSGGVSWTSTLPATAPVTVNVGRTTLNPIEVDDPASLRASFRSPSNVATTWPKISVAHAKLPAGYKVFPSPTATAHQTSIDATNLFPHRDAYGVYAGSCVKNNPSFWKSDYFQTGVNGYIILNPGQNLVAVNVTVPLLTVNVTKRSSAPRARVVVKQVDTPECQEEWTYIVNSTATSVPVLAYLPFGRFKVCVDDGHATSPRRRVSSSGSSNSHYPSPPTTDMSSTDPSAHRMMPPSSTTSRNGALAQTDAVNLDSSSSSGSCPPTGW